MIIFKKTHDLAEYLAIERGKNLSIGFVPTMGALHQGHASLIKLSKPDNDITVCSIFVNPTQFNDQQDFEHYPITIDEDVEMLIDAGCNVLFLPSVSEMYPGGAEAIPAYDFGYLDTILEGAQRPGHFRGVGQVMGQLLRMVQPHNLYMGQKDYQQCIIVKKLLALLHLSSVNLHICPIVREPDGLAMSSRNRRLTDAQRVIAGTIYQCLVSIKAKVAEGNFPKVQRECTELLAAKGLAPEYVALANAGDLTELDNYNMDVPMVALIAARVGDVRLIDNMLL
jgi:pantoate--beta-alanine ligase